MKRALIAIILITGLYASPARAAALFPYGAASQACGSGTTCNLLNVTPRSLTSLANPNQALLVCLHTFAGAAAATGLSATVNSVAMTQWGSTITQNKTVFACFHKTLAAGDSSLTINTSWTTANQAVVTARIIYPTNDIAPTFGGTASNVCGPNAGSCAPATLTPVQSGDLIFNECGFGGAATPDWNSNRADPFPSLGSTQTIGGFIGWSGSSGSPTTTVATQTSGGAIYDIACFTGDIEASGTGSVIVGSADTYNAGSSTTLFAANPLNGHANDALITGILENTVAVARTAPPIIGIRNCTGAAPNGASTMTLTTPSGTVQGDMLIVGIYSQVGSATGGTIVSGFTQQTRTTAVNFFTTYSLLLAGAPSANYTATISGNNLFVGMLCSLFDSSGGTLTVGATATATTVGGGTNFTGARVTTLNNNAAILNFWQQATPSGTITVPTSQFSNGWKQAPAFTTGFFNLHTAGLTPTQTATSTANANWNTAELEVYSTAAAALSGSTVWTHQTPTAVTDPTSAAQVDVYSMVAPNAESIGPSLFTFASSESTSESIMVDAGNLNTTTPIDSSSSLTSAGLHLLQQSPLPAPTANDELVLDFNGYTSGTGGYAVGMYPTQIVTGTKLNARLLMVSGALTAQMAGLTASTYASIALGLQAASTPARTTANVDENGNIEEIFGLAPAPLPPETSLPFELEIP